VPLAKGKKGVKNITGTKKKRLSFRAKISCDLST
jgi:hypothetical protein